MQLKKKSAWLALAIVFALLAGAVPAAAAEGVTLFTPYTSVSAPPGESLSYTVEVINDTNQIQNVPLTVDMGGTDWKYELTAGGRTIRQISVFPASKENITFQVDVPLNANKGDYTIRLVAGDFGALALRVNVSEQGSFSTEMNVDQPNMQGHADSTFTYSITLRNRTADKQLYALRSTPPEGWDVQFKHSGSNVTSVNIEPNASETIQVVVTPPQKVEAGTYKIKVEASTSSTSASAELEAVVTGKYDIRLRTPNDLLSTSITAGSTRTLELLVENTGTAELRDIDLSATTPVNWEVTFEPKTILSIAPGESASVQATIKADKESIAGDYVVGMTASTNEKSSNAQFRVAVKTSVLWGWIGVIIILAVIGGIYYLFRTYGRR
jgi:uncharacterized membrane protein